MFRFYYVVITSAFFVVYMLVKYRIYENNPQKYTEEKRYEFAREIMDHMRRRGHAKTEVYGLENLPEEGGYILYSNHQGKYDALGIMLVHEKPASVLMEKKQSEKIVAKQVVNLVGGKRLDFEDPRQQLRVLGEISKEVKEGRKYLIFPEGGYKDNKNTLQTFHSGCFRCAISAKCPVIPVALIDSYKALNGNSLKKCVTQVHFLEPIYYDEYQSLKKNELCELVKARIQAKLDERLSA